MNSAVTGIQYLALSGIVYSNLPTAKIIDSNNPSGRNWTVEEIIAANLVNGYHDSGGNVASEYVALCTMLDYTLLSFLPNNTNGFAAAAFQAPSTIDEKGNTVPGEIVFSFRGTELFSDNLHDLGQDLKIMMAEEGTLDAQFNDAYSFWLQTIQDVGGGSGYSGYSFTGHSLGGGIAQYMTYATNEGGQAVTFNAVGVGQMISGVNPSEYEDSITDYVNENDIIGQYGVQLGKTTYVKDDGNVNYNVIADTTATALDAGARAAAESGRFADAVGMTLLSGITRLSQAITNTGVDILFGAHKLNTFFDVNGNFSANVGGPNLAVSAISKSVFYYSILYENAVDGAQALMSAAGEVIAEVIYNTAVAIGNTAEAMGNAAVYIGDYLFGDHVTITGTDDSDSLYTVLNKSAFITGKMGNDSISGSSFKDYIDGGLGDDYISAGSGDDMVYGGYGDDFIDAGDDADVALGGAGNDTINGGLGDDVLAGEAGDDIIFGDILGHGYGGYGNIAFGTGNDTLNGGTGNDFLAGGGGNDTYVFGRGYGQDIIDDYTSVSNGWGSQNTQDGGSLDTISFLEGVASTDIQVHRRDATDLELSIVGTTDKITVSGYFDPNNYRVIERLKFADGTIWNEATIREKAQSITEPRSSNDVMHIDGYDDQGDKVLLASSSLGLTVNTFAGNDTVYAGSGDDLITTGDGDDTLYGGTGNDALYSDVYANWSLITTSNGQDTLDGGEGDDLLIGGGGNDTYVFGRGYGHDTVSDYNMTYNNWGSYYVTDGGSLDTISFKDGVSPQDIMVSRRSNFDLEFAIAGTNDVLTVTDYFNPTRYSLIERVTFADGTVWDEAMVREKAREIRTGGLNGSASNDFNGYDDQSDIMYGTIEGNVMTGWNGDDVLYGGAGDDTLYGDYINAWNGASSGEGADVLDGGTGDDVLMGSGGSDTYIFGRGYGHDTIKDYLTTSNGWGGYNITDGGELDKIVLKQGVATADVTLQRVGDDLVLKIADTDDTLTVQNQFSSSYQDRYAIEQIVFDDGTVWDKSVITDKATHMNGTSGNDILYGYENWDDRVLGNAGDDSIYSYSGADTLDGGTGNDYLEGGSGNDTYVFGLGYGIDTIYDSDQTEGNIDTIALGTGIMPSDIVAKRNGDNLELHVTNEDILIVERYFSRYSKGNYSYNVGENGNKVEMITFADGTGWDVETIKAKVRLINGTDYDDVLYGYETADTINGGSGNDIIYANYGDDTLIGGTGNDVIYSDSGNDTYVFNGNFGSDSVYDYLGNDLVVFDQSQDNLIFERTGNSLRISSNGTTNSVDVGYWYQYNDYKVETIKSADGSTITSTQVDQLIQAMASWSSDNNGMSWSQGLASNSQEVQSIVSQYWTAPTA